MSLPASRNQPLEAAHPKSSGPGNKWYGHNACVCHSYWGCDGHREPGLFYNTLLPPMAPMKLVQDGDRWYMSEEDDKPNTQSATSRPIIAFFRALPSKLRESLSPNFHFKRNFSSAADDKSLLGAKEGLLSGSEEQQKEPDKHIQPPPPYSEISNSIPQLPCYPGKVSGTASLSAKGAGANAAWVTMLPFDTASFGTLKPMFSTMAHYLAFYHLHSTRVAINGREWANTTCIVTSLCCDGRLQWRNHNSPSVRWSSELYFSSEFLQKQEISYILDMHNTDPEAISFTICPHITVSLAKVTLRMTEDGLKASAHIYHTEGISSKQIDGFKNQYRYERRISAERRRNTYAENVDWRNDAGSLADLYSCKICHCDLERSLEVRGQQLHVRLTVCKNLGAGINRFDPKWRALLKGSGTARPFPGRPGEAFYSVYRQVMRVAHLLKRPNLHPVTFRAEDGDFTASPGVSTGDHAPWFNSVRNITYLHTDSFVNLIYIQPHQSQYHCSPLACAFMAILSFRWSLCRGLSQLAEVRLWGLKPAFHNRHLMSFGNYDVVLRRDEKFQGIICAEPVVGQEEVTSVAIGLGVTDVDGAYPAVVI
ncbi:hypothetical protein PG994_005024 [Apiospora phragmitis]|uniref:Uncharacterized protein n=1 Tax=Apiospora phragmitis TaxID=2905665 RepID=A0ABR1VS94_9PEZI